MKEISFEVHGVEGNDGLFDRIQILKEWLKQQIKIN